MLITVTVKKVLLAEDHTVLVLQPADVALVGEYHITTSNTAARDFRPGQRMTLTLGGLS